MNITNELNRIDQYQEIPDMDAGCQRDFAILAKIVRDCHRAGFVTDAGEVRKVLGTLPITADGAIAGHGGIVWPAFLTGPDDEGGKVQYAIIDSYDGGRLIEGDEACIGMCYSTKAAAEAGRGEGK